jgi:hypothetical protein
MAYYLFLSAAILKVWVSHSYFPVTFQNLVNEAESRLHRQATEGPAALLFRLSTE